MEKEVRIMPLKYHRFIRGMTQLDLEEATGIYSTKISLVETGRRSFRQEEKEKLSKALGVPVKKLFPKDK